MPKADVYLVSHHGADTSNNPVLLDALNPDVAIVNNGPRKGGEPRTMAYLIKQLRDIGVFQLHRNVRPGAVNAEPGRIANLDEACKGELITLRVEPNSGQFTVSIPSRHVDRVFSAQ